MAQQAVQLFTVTGQFVATVDVTMDDGGRYPRAVKFRGHVYTFENGRYARADAAPEATEVAARAS